MKSICIATALILLTIGAVSADDPAPTPTAILTAVVPGAIRITPNSAGYFIQTATGPRTAMRTSQGWFITGNPDSPAIRIYKTSSGYYVK